MTTPADVRRWNPAAVESAFTRLGVARDALLDADADLGTATPPAGWTGAAADGAAREHGRLAEELRRTVAGVTALRPALGSAIDTITALHGELDRIDGLAAAHGFRIGPDGRVTAPPDVPGTGALVAPLRDARLVEITTSLAGVLRRADELDASLAATLQAVADGRIDDGSGTGLLGAATHVLGGDRPPPAPPADATPGRNAAWWAGLTPAQRESILLTDPGLVGNRDGIPAAVRDEANRARLDTETVRIDAAIAATGARLDALPEPLPPPLGAADRERQDLDHQLAELQDQRDALTAVSDTVDSGRGDRRLLLLDVDGHAEPRAAVAVGDIATADHVAVYTPGFTTTVADSLPGVTEELSGVRDQATAQLAGAGVRGESVAAVAWLGYDIPQVDTVADADRSVLDSAAAQAGGTDLARFLDGIGAARPGDDPHLTALGHSYGSTTTGYALQQATGVDDAVVWGSPGLSTNDVTDLNVPAGHLGVVEADGDPVARAGVFGYRPFVLPGVTDLSSDESVVDGHRLDESTGHSDYLRPGTTSQYNIAATVAGLDGHRVHTPSPPVEVVDLVPEWAR